jgi:hypothetical protein
LAEHGDKVSADVKTEIETALAEAKTAVEGGDADDMQQKTAALTQAAMKLGQAIYDQQQQSASPGGDGGELVARPPKRAPHPPTRMLSTRNSRKSTTRTRADDGAAAGGRPVPSVA